MPGCEAGLLIPFVVLIAINLPTLFPFSYFDYYPHPYWFDPNILTDSFSGLLRIARNSMNYWTKALIFQNEKVRKFHEIILGFSHEVL